MAISLHGSWDRSWIRLNADALKLFDVEAPKVTFCAFMKVPWPKFYIKFMKM